MTPGVDWNFAISTSLSVSLAVRVTPALLLGLHLLATIFSATGWPVPVKNAWRSISRPFRNFLVLDDLLDPVDLELPKNPIAHRALSLLACIEAIGWCGCVGYSIYVESMGSITIDATYFICWVYIATACIAKPPLTPPFIFIAFALALALIAVFDSISALFESPIASGKLVFDIVFGLAHITFAWVAGTLPLKPYRPGLHVAKDGDVPSSRLSCPEDDVNLWSWSSFSFVEPIMHVASKRTLQDSDVWDLSPFFLHKNIFTKCLEYRADHPDRSLLRFLLESNSLDLILDVTLELWKAVVGFVPPFALQEILSALSTDTPEAKRTAYFWAFMTFLAHLSFAQVDLFKAWHTRRCYERTRGQMFCALHYKALRREEISGHVAKGEESSKAELGKIVNLMQGDSYSVAQRFWEFSGLISSPVRIVIALVFLYRVLGWSSLMGVAIVAIVATLNYPLGKYNISITRSSWKAKDKRMNVVNELLQNIRFLKFYGWEYEWSAKADTAREDELRWRVKGNVVDTIMSFIWVWMPSATALTCFLCYTVVAGERLTVSKAFTSIALFSYLQEPMVALPGQIFAMLHAYVSMQRIEAFLGENEVPDWATSLSRDVDRGDSSETQETGFVDATFEWEVASDDADGPPRFHLGPLNLIFPSGKLTLVSGATGSGKSALLEALLGEMHCTSGKVLINKSNHQVAYCGQSPWLEHATIKDNVTFGSTAPFNEERYQAVLHACALEQDLSILVAGDMTEIGEKGITLSGGQRARIALARAFYSRAKLILLDDPLAAVDMHTAQHIVKNCFAGPLAADRTIVLVTHHLALCLPFASYLVELAKGHVEDQGTIQDLRARGILSSIIQEEDEPLPETTGGTEDESKGFGAPMARQNGGNGALVEVEQRAEGQVSLRTYLTYIRAAGIHCWILTLALQLLIRAINVGNQFFLARWGEAYEEDAPEFLKLLTLQFGGFKYPWSDLPSPNANVKPWFLIYLYISAAGAFTVILYIILGYYASLQASRTLFKTLLRRLTRAPLRFFDTTPIGRILNRFTTDINTIDGALQGSARGCMAGVLNFAVSFLTMLAIVPTFAPFALVIAWLYLRLAPSYVRAARDLRRLESVSLSPAFAGFDELLRGITHIRAFAMENRYQNNFYRKVDKFQSFDHVYWLVNFWLSWRYDCLGSVVVFTATMFALWQGVSNGLAAIVIVQAGIFAEASRQLVRVSAQLELDFNSVERVIEYFDVPQEAPAINPNYRPPAYWPSTSGDLRVDNLVITYAPHLPPVLKGISFTINPGEKVGVVGRTGSGKSTLVLALLRMLEPTSGSIYIDAIDISKIGLEDLRTKLTIISQDVSLFSGTIRSNLDPLEKYTDEECREVLKRCHLESHFAFNPTPSEPTLLDMGVSQNSLSAGEKQLLALARAILRGTNIIIMDEATSQIDMELDDKIQKTVREETAGAIVITIAHRLKTVMDYDRILVVDDGKIAEFDKPQSLLKKTGGVFREICRKSSDWASFSALERSDDSE
ncbi:pleiotropic drug resistance ABC transporter [Coprinopsis marcescibilis]|uniref:Pleiotropic drug resistance ABC transporter n=1 Tax=Coprinopsis marcescibilis TaxID=230819 RepID=A0A5C3KVN5_COPMA|nr:pleiotropic drug resistance ABC transporter [Coprinopsis marcescibilis]